MSTRPRSLRALNAQVVGTLTAHRLEVDELIIDPAVFASLLVNGDATITGNLAVGGNETLAGDLSVGGSETIAVNLSVGGDGAVAGDFAVGDDLAVTDDGSFGGDVTISGNIDLPNTTTTVGMFSKAGTRFLHNFGTDNTFLGVSAGNTTLTTANSNVGVGTNAFSALTTAGFNIALGHNAGTALSTGSFNSAVGPFALENLPSGVSNTAVGALSLRALTSGTANTGIGSGAAQLATTLNNSTLLGSATDVPNGSTNATSLGFNAVCIASNQVTLGDANVTTLRCATTTITAISDIREKKNIVPITLGIDFVRKLKPVKFHKLNQTDDEPRAYGFIAQDVIAALETSGESLSDYAGILHNKITDRYELRFGELQVIALKGLQELADEVDMLKREIAELKKAQ